MLFGVHKIITVALFPPFKILVYNIRNNKYVVIGEDPKNY